MHIEWIIWSNLFQLADCLLTVEEVLDNIFRDTLPHLHKMSDADNRFYSSSNYFQIFLWPVSDPPLLAPQPIEERSPHPESGMPPPPYTKDAQPGPSNNANVLNDDNDDEFWISLDQDAAASERFLSFLIEYVSISIIFASPNCCVDTGQLSNNPHVLPRAEFVQLASLYRLAPQTYLNDEIIHYFAQQWAKEAPQKNLLWLDSFFASSFLFREQECITADAQTHRQDLLFHRLDKCFLVRLSLCFRLDTLQNLTTHIPGTMSTSFRHLFHHHKRTERALVCCVYQLHWENNPSLRQQSLGSKRRTNVTCVWIFPAHGRGLMWWCRGCCG